MSLTTYLKTTFGASTCLLVALAVTPQVSQAVPSFARQTGLPCSSCHTVFPELTEFGRDFKMNGYTMTGLAQVQQKSEGETAGVKINEIPPLSAMLQLSMTSMSKAAPGVQNNNVEFPHQFSFFFAGEISQHMGSFVQLTYAQDTSHFTLDNTDIRYANHTQIAGADTVYGLTLDNNPTVGDVWNSTPAWGYPWSSPSSALTPMAATLIDGGLGGDVAGLGGYTYWNSHLYAGFSLYRSAHPGYLAPVDTCTDPNGVSIPCNLNTIKNAAPYWRLAWQQSLGADTLMIGTYGISASMYPGLQADSGVSGPTNKYTDVALDMQYEHPVAPDDLLTIHSTYIHENQNLDASLAAQAASNSSDTLKTFKLDGTYHSGDDASFSLGYFNTTGSTDALLYAPQALYGSANGSPDSNGWIGDASYLPWQNTKLSIQYTYYNKFNGATNNYDGSGRSAKDNNTLFLQTWFMW